VSAARKVWKLAWRMGICVLLLVWIFHSIFVNEARIAARQNRLPWDELTRTPSRLTAEAPNRAERARLLAAVTASGFIDDYSGVRISKTGRRFKISRATVWNLLTEDNQPCGQAAMFGEWEFL